MLETFLQFKYQFENVWLLIVAISLKEKQAEKF